MALVGTGVGTKHARMYQTLPDLYEVTAVCEIDEQRRNEFVDQIGVGFQTNRLEDLFSQDLDIVDILTLPHFIFHKLLQRSKQVSMLFSKSRSLVRFQKWMNLKE